MNTFQEGDRVDMGRLGTGTVQGLETFDDGEIGKRYAVVLDDPSLWANGKYGTDTAYFVPEQLTKITE